MIPRGGVIGILGAGQLGRMLALAAARLGYRAHVWAPEPGPAHQVTDRATLAPYEDEIASERFAAEVEVVTSEFENVPAAVAERLAARVPVRPGPRALAVCQDRVAEKSLLRALGLPTAPWWPVRDEGELRAALAALGGPGILKTARLGYDGKGQARLDGPERAALAWREIGGPAHGHAVLEGLVPFAWEGSQVIARGPTGEIAAWPLVQNEHETGILRRTRAPAPRGSAELAERARDLARRIAEELDLVGLLAVELFVTAEGDLLVNELAARPHNSAHWTMDGAWTDQFEQGIRAIAGLPLGDPGLRAPTRMENLLGAEILDRARWLSLPNARLHDYGKAEVVPGRKMGHVNLLEPG